MFSVICLLPLVLACQSAFSHPLLSHGALVSRAGPSSEPENADSGTPVTEFMAQAGTNVAGLKAAALKAHKAGQTYPTNDKFKNFSTIFTDWASFKNVSPPN
jgi:hypothetical protein